MSESYRTDDVLKQHNKKWPEKPNYYYPITKILVDNDAFINDAIGIYYNNNVTRSNLNF